MYAVICFFSTWYGIFVTFLYLHNFAATQTEPLAQATIYFIKLF